MTQQLDDMRHYIRLTESAPSPIVEDAFYLDDLVEDIGPTSRSLMLEDVNDMIFKLRSYSERDGSDDYIQGVEEGLALAANMLERLVERHIGLSSK